MAPAYQRHLNGRAAGISLCLPVRWLALPGEVYRNKPKHDSTCGVRSYCSISFHNVINAFLFHHKCGYGTRKTRGDRPPILAWRPLLADMGYLTASLPVFYTIQHLLSYG